MSTFFIGGILKVGQSPIEENTQLNLFALQNRLKSRINSLSLEVQQSHSHEETIPTYFWKHGNLTNKWGNMVRVVHHGNFLLDFIRLICGTKVDFSKFGLSRFDLLLSFVFIRQVFLQEHMLPHLQGHGS